MKNLQILVALILSLMIVSVYAEPTSNSVYIASLRPYLGGSTVFIYVNDPMPCPSGTIYTLDISSAVGKAIYGTAITAMAAGKPVQIEVVAGACAYPYMSIQSIYLNR